MDVFLIGFWVLVTFIVGWALHTAGNSPAPRADDVDRVWLEADRDATKPRHLAL